MMDFVLLVLAITVAMVLASVITAVIGFILVSNEKVVNWYSKWIIKYMKKFEDLDYESLEKEL